MSEICRLCGCEGKNFLSIFDKQSEGNINDSRYADDAMIFSRILVKKSNSSIKLNVLHLMI